MRTYRRLDDPTRFYGISWRGWIALGVAAAVLYLFAKVSPFDPRATLSLLLIACVLPAMAVFAAGGQAFGAGRYLAALVGWALWPKDYVLSEAPATGGIVLDVPPPGVPSAAGHAGRTGYGHA